jgi:hypothetical protein
MRDEDPISQIELLFAKNQKIPNEVLRTLHSESKADFVLLFRPESVLATQELSQQKLTDTGSPGPQNTAVPTSTIVSGVHTAPFQTTNETERSYKLSAALVDLQTGKELKYGEYSGTASRTEKNYAGVAPALDAEPLLADLMTALARALLDE